ncbi:MAG: energy-coupling factor transporter ATPase [Candidatus Zixiibacteriota bacterium]
MIKFSDVTYRYPQGIRGVDGLSLEIGSGEKCAIIGNNGSGKTTFALLAKGLLKAESGQIEIDDLNPAAMADSKALKRKIGLVFQNPDNQLVASTVEREIAFTLENLNMPRVEMKERVENMLRLFYLDDKRERLTSQLSGGEKQKLALASVMAASPEILILDEPGSFLDEAGKRLLREVLDRLLSTHPLLTVVRITQYSYIAEQYPRLIVLSKGKVLLSGTPDETFSNPALCREAGIEPPLRHRLRRGPLESAKKIVPTTAGNLPVHQIKVQTLEFAYQNGSAGARLFCGESLEIDNRSVYGLVGPSGSGKSTLIQLMAKLLKPDRGQILYIDFDSDNPRLAVSFQHPERQFFLETVEKEIRFGAENFGIADIDRISQDCYRMVGLDRAEFFNRDPFSLSGGEKRRLAFAAILSMKPSYIFFDEPTSGLDAEGIGHFRCLVKSLQEQGVGVLIISHYGNIIFDLCQRIITLNQGKIESILSREEFFCSAAYRSFLSEPEVISFQLQEWGEIRRFDEAGLIEELGYKIAE